MTFSEISAGCQGAACAQAAFELVDLGDRVLALVHDYGRRDGMSAEVALPGGTIWTFEQGKVKHAAFYPDRHEALEAAGLSE